jgi:hypothetical protein
MNPRTKRALAVALLAALGVLQSATATAKLAPTAYDLSAFLAAEEPNQVVFVGRVVASDPFDAGASFLSAQRLTFAVSKWWRGKPRPSVVALGRVERPRGTTVDGAFDFSAQVGEEWFIAGYETAAEVVPSRYLSVRVVNGALPPDIAHALQGVK